MPPAGPSPMTLMHELFSSWTTDRTSRIVTSAGSAPGICSSRGEIDAYLAPRLGPEPLAATPRRGGCWASGSPDGGRRSSRRSSTSASSPGLGNIYADEALWHARIHPLRLAGSLTDGEHVALLRATRKALRLGIERQGATLRDYAQPDGTYGAMQDEFRAYGRGGEPCDRCRTPLSRIVVGGRSTTFCPRCQPGEG